MRERPGSGNDMLSRVNKFSAQYLEKKRILHIQFSKALRFEVK